MFLVLLSSSIGPHFLGYSMLTISQTNIFLFPWFKTLIFSLFSCLLSIGIVLAGIYLIEVRSEYFWYQGSE